MLPGTLYLSGKWYMVCLRQHNGFMLTPAETIQLLEGYVTNTPGRFCGNMLWLDDTAFTEAVL